MGLRWFLLLVGLRRLFRELSSDKIGLLGLGFDRLIVYTSNTDKL